MNYYISDQMILRNDFLTELERLTKSKIAEVHFNKKLLGSGALDFSNKTNIAYHRRQIDLCL